MSSTFSPSLRLELIGDGDQSGIWGQTTNSNLGTLIEQAIAGVITIDMADTNYAMTNFNGVSDESRNQVIVLIGTNTAARNLIAPLVEKTYTVKNSTTGGFAIQIIGASGTGVTIPNGMTALVYCDGTNFYTNINGSTGNFSVTGALSVTGATALSSALTYGGVTLSNSVTGTGSMTLSASPTFTGVPAAPTASAGTSTTQLATTAFVTTAIASAGVSGQITMWPTGTAPSGWLLCNGAAVSRTTYATLFAVVSTTFGSGDGSTTFNLPNYTNRMPYGTTVGATGGSADAVVVSHTHTASVTDPGHTHTYQGSNYQPNNAAGSQPDWIGASTMTTNSAVTGISVSNSTTGVSGTNANLPPYLGINFIIKT